MGDVIGVLLTICLAVVVMWGVGIGLSGWGTHENDVITERETNLLAGRPGKYAGHLLEAPGNYTVCLTSRLEDRDKNLEPLEYTVRFRVDNMTGPVMYAWKVPVCSIENRLCGDFNTTKYNTLVVVTHQANAHKTTKSWWVRDWTVSST